MPTVGEQPDESYVEELFRARYLEMVRLAGLLGADDPEDIAQEAFTRLRAPAAAREPRAGRARPSSWGAGMNTLEDRVRGALRAVQTDNLGMIG
jgi:DNA-directed RNA polymerase specialized sigma24 family protein